MDKLVADATAVVEAAKTSGSNVDEAELTLHHMVEMARIHVD
jgi:F-type H+-transporting ATPase subunit epsilon